MTTKSLAAWADSPGAHQLLAACLSLPLTPSGLLDIRHYDPLWWKEVTVAKDGVAWAEAPAEQWTPWSRTPVRTADGRVFPKYGHRFDFLPLWRQRRGTDEYQVLCLAAGGWCREDWVGTAMVRRGPQLLMTEELALKYAESL